MNSIPDEGMCGLCGGLGPFSAFFKGASLRETRCPACGSSRRNRDVARVLLQESGADAALPLAQQLEALRPLHVYELQAQGPLHILLSRLPRYLCSEYFRGVPPGGRNEQGVLCQDATRLTFADSSFDVVISQDIFEHIPDPWAGFGEISRVLRPGGRHIFTVPVHEGRKTRQRARLDETGAVTHLLPPVHHKDPLDPEGALVFWEYGDDLPDLLQERGIPARKALHARLHSPDELCRVDDEADYARWLEARAAGNHAGFFIYNPVVFVAEKAK